MNVSKPQEGMIAESLQGRDKGALYVVCRIDGDYVYVADGTVRKLENPKRKNLKHLRLSPLNVKEFGIRYPWDKSFDVRAARVLKDIKNSKLENKTEE